MWDIKNILIQEEINNYLKKIYQDGRVPHALIFLGPEGYGGLLLARSFAMMLLDSKEKNLIDHPDLHFSFPMPTEKKNFNYRKLWLNFLEKFPYGNISQWLKYINSENNQCQIFVEDSIKIIKTFNLKSCLGGYKILILWMPERLNIAAANKLLKIFEYPPEKSIFLLVGHNEYRILKTILSRMQILRLKPINIEKIQIFLQNKYNFSLENAIKISKLSEGDISRVLLYIEQSEFEFVFLNWLRKAFLAKNNQMMFNWLINFSEEIQNWGREKQKNFLDLSLNILRQALHQKYGYIQIECHPFLKHQINWKSFSDIINRSNLNEIIKEFNKAIFKIELNSKPRVVFFYLSIKIMHLLNNDISF